MATKNYSIVEYFTQTPFLMLAIEVFHSCPTKRSMLITGIEAIDQNNSQVIMFDTMCVNPRLPHHVSFQIQVIYQNKNIFNIIVDEGASTSIMSMSC